MTSLLSNMALQSAFPVEPSYAGPGLQMDVLDHHAIVAICALRIGATSLDARIEELLGVALPQGPRCAMAGTVCVLGVGPGKWLVINLGAASRWAATLAEQLSGVAAVSDLSGAYGVLRLSGPRVPELLSGGVFVDIHPSRFGVGAVAATSLGDFAIILWCTDAATDFRIAVPRSLGVDAWHWLHRRARQMDAGANTSAASNP